MTTTVVWWWVIALAVLLRPWLQAHDMVTGVFVALGLLAMGRAAGMRRDDGS